MKLGSLCASAALGLALLSSPTEALAGSPVPAADPWAALDEPDPSPPADGAPRSAADTAPLIDDSPRPIRRFALELNPLALFAVRVGGQVQVGIAGPLTLVGGISYVRLGGSKEEMSSSYDHGIPVPLGRPPADGYSTELGVRAFVPIVRRHSATDARVDLAFTGSWVHDRLQEERSKLGCTGAASCASARKELVVREGVALDVGLQVTTARGFYLLTGIGHQWVVEQEGSLSRHSGRSYPGSLFEDPADVAQRSSMWPRLLLSAGVTF